MGHCQDSFRLNGLLLLTLPTGFGKTHYVLEYIAEHIRQRFPQRIWFVTNLKKNLPIDSLRERIGVELFERDVLFLNSYTNQVLQFLASNDIPDLIRNQFRSYHPFRKAVEAMQNAPAHPGFKDFLQKELTAKELAFRKELKSYLKKYIQGCKNPSEKLKVLRANPDLRWIEKMYPSVQFYEKSVFFCTIDKFYLYVDTIIGPNIRIVDSEHMEGSIVFIDEFDATKQNIKRAIIDHAVRFNQDILSLFIQIHYGIQNRKLATPRIKGASEKQLTYLKKKFEDLTGEAWRIYAEYQFQSHFYHQGKAGGNRAFLFHDFEYHTIFDDGEHRRKPGFLTRKFDKEDQTNYIRIDDDQPDKNQENFLFLLNDLRSFIHLFSFFVGDYARIYKQVHDGANSEEISIENAIRTTLDLFDLHDTKTQHYFIDHISQQVTVSRQDPDTRFDLSPVNQGFRYYDILNSKAHDATSKILYADTLTTPETWLLNLCQRANVIGISATAGFDSPISNYSLSHLKHHLQDRFYELDPTAHTILQEEFQRKNQHAAKRKIEPVVVKCPSGRKHALESLFSAKETVLQFLHQFTDLQEYEVQRYVKLGKAYLHFIQHPGIHSFLCLLNKFPRTGRFESFREQDLKELFKEIRIEHLQEDEEMARNAMETELRIVDSQEFEEKLEEINQHLASSGRIFLISTYQTMGAGQNIQYPAPEGIEVIEVNDLDYGGRKKDYDGIYLEKPTYLLNYFQPDTDIKDEHVLDYLFEVEYLAEGGAISRKEKKDRIEFAFRRRFNTQLRAPSNRVLYERRMVAEHFCRVLIQAVGRLSRTRLKPPVTHILYDEAIRDYIQFFPQADYLLIPEFEALLQHGRTHVNAPNRDQVEVTNRNIQHSLIFSTLIRRLVRDIPHWKPDTIRFWENLREFVLKYPTISGERLQQSKLQKFYIAHPAGKPIDSYYYHSEDDFGRRLELHFDEQKGKEASASAARLPELLRVPLVEELFREKGYAMDFQPDDFILSPPLFQNIYLGALGEVIGSRLLEFYGIKCLPLAEGQYELFDAQISEDLFVDFKYWGGNTRVEAREQKAKIQEKMKLANAKYVLIINVVSPGARFEQVVGEDGIVEIPGLLDLQKGQINQSIIEFIHQYISEHA
jgi:hypothetical protein